MSRKKNSLKYLFELITVFLGVTAAFMLDRWAENNRARKEEAQYISSIYEENEEDRAYLKNMLDFYQKKIKKVEKLIRLLNDRDSLYTIESLLPKALFSHLFFKPSASTWESLKGSGELKLIQNLQLKIQLSKLHRMYYYLEKHEKNIEMYLQQDLLPYALKHINLMTMKFFDRQSLLEPYFMNLVKTYYFIIQDYFNSLNTAYQLCLKVKQLLETELK